MATSTIEEFSIQQVENFFSQYGLKTWRFKDKFGALHTIAIEHPKHGIIYEFKLRPRRPRVSKTELREAVKAIKQSGMINS